MNITEEAVKRPTILAVDDTKENLMVIGQLLALLPKDAASISIPILSTPF
jgi:hypothetical protein